MGEQRRLIVEAARARLRSKIQEARQAVEEAVWTELQTLCASRDATYERLEDALRLGFERVGSRLDALRIDRDEKEKKQKEFNKDPERREAALQAAGLYATFAARAYAAEIGLRADLRRLLEEAFQTAWQDVVKLRTSKLKELDETYKHALEKLPAADKVLVLGPAPAASDASFDELAAYAEAVKGAQEGLEDFLGTSTWNPFRNTLVKDFAAGVLSGFTKIAGGGDGEGEPSWRVAWSSLKELLESGARDALADLESTKDRVLGAVKGQARTALDAAVGTAKKKLAEHIDDKVKGMIG